MTKAAADDTSVARAESRRFVLLCGLAPALITVALVIFRPDFVADVDRRAYDILLRSVHTRPPGGRVVIVDVDERSLSTSANGPGDATHRAAGRSTARTRRRRRRARHRLRRTRSAIRREAAVTRTSARRALARSSRARLRDDIRRPTADEPRLRAASGKVAVVQRETKRSANRSFTPTGAICNLAALAEAAGVRDS